MHRRLAEFVAFVRERGVPVGIGAEVDLGRALTILPVLDRDHVRDAAGAILAKSPEQLARVTEAFDVFFSTTFSRESVPSPGQLSSARRLRVSARRAGPVPVTPELEDEPPTRTTTFGAYSAQAPGAGHVLTQLSPREMLCLRRGARRFRRRTATLPGRRFARTRRGAVDFPETLRRSVGRDGEWIELLRHAPNPRRTKLVILWDVSGSMREYDALLFGLVYSLERVSRSARVFAFSTRIQEITSEIRRNGYRRATVAVATCIAGAEGGTQIGPCLQRFSEQYPAAIRDRATVVVVSDGWDRAESGALADELRRIRRRSHFVAWVSPYARRAGFEPRTAGLVAALPHTDALLAPEDFQSPFPLPAIDWKRVRVPA
ncbi:MAG: VWA domain-containing protein [Thermoplasmata archaeon]